MVPAWATVAIALGAASISGAAGVLTGWLGVRSQLRQQLRTHQFDAAAEFGKQFGGSTDAVRYALDHPDEEEARKNAVWLSGELLGAAGKLTAFYGSKSPPGVEAREAVDALRRAARAVSKQNREEAARALAEAEDHRGRFDEAFVQTLS